MNTPPDNDGESAPTDEVLSGEVVATPDGADSVDGSPEQPGDLPGALGGLGGALGGLGGLLGG